jgi:hypothetical protein
VLRALALGYFDSARDDELRPLLRLRLLTRLELSHLPHLSDTLLRALCCAAAGLGSLVLRCRKR